MGVLSSLLEDTSRQRLHVSNGPGPHEQGRSCMTAHVYPFLVTRSFEPVPPTCLDGARLNPYALHSLYHEEAID